MLTDGKKMLLGISTRAGVVRELSLESAMGNRHGLITGATGTGKTVTLQTITEMYSDLGVPVFLADVKGDLSGLAAPARPAGKIAARISELGLERIGYRPRAYPVCFFDVFGRHGHPLRTTISEMGPLLLSRLLHLNEVQSGLMHLIFKIADELGWLLLDLKDLRAMLKFVADERAALQTTYGNIAPASVGAIQRALLRLEEEGGESFFGEPDLNLEDLLQTDGEGRGMVNILAADELINSPQIYSSLLLWLLSELFERLPECGDRDRPRLVCFFDEAHLLFKDAPAVLLDKIAQVTRLIRSRGVGIYFVSQNPADIPDEVLGQLGNRVQHALRAFTPRDQKAVRAAASAFRPNPEIDTAQVISELGVGEALISCLDADGAPQVVERGFVLPPQSRVGPLSADERQAVLARSLLKGIYDTPIDRESAYEILERRTREKMAAAAQEAEAAEREKAARSRRRADEGNDFLEAITRSAGRTITSTIGRQIGRSLVRGLLGGIFGRR